MADSKPKSKEPTKSQKDRFKEAAQSVGADQSEDALEKAFQKISPRKTSK